MIESLIDQLKTSPITSAPVIVALSGGADSVALLSVLISSGYNCIAAHCNFHLRGDESNRDQRHCERITKELGVPLEIIHFDVETYQKEAPKSKSIEMACRELRYSWFENLRLKYHADYIAVGHHRDDNIETVLLNLTRGTGLGGVKGMEVISGQHIWRPLLRCTRNEILGYIKAQGLDFVVDHTNLQNEYQRNRFRNIAIPALLDAYPESLNGLERSICMLHDDYTLYRQLIVKTVEGSKDEQGNIDLNSLCQSTSQAALLLFEYFKEDGLNYPIAHDILAAVNNSGKTFIFGGNKYIISRGKLIKYQKHEEFTTNVETFFDIEIIETKYFQKPTDASTACFDLSVLDGQPLSIRYWKPGDRISPFGMKGTKKLSDIFSDAHMSISEKEQTLLLVKGNDILWIPDIRCSRLYQVTDNSKKYVLFSKKTHVKT